MVSSLQMYPLFRPLFFALDPETAHDLAFALRSTSSSPSGEQKPLVLSARLVRGRFASVVAF